MKLYIKFMVSLRCKLVVQEALTQLGLHYISVVLGMAELEEVAISDRQRESLKSILLKYGLELLADRKKVLVEKVKTVIIEMIRSPSESMNIKYSIYISEKMGYDYTYLGNVFSKETGLTIQQFIILHKVERAKELIEYDEMTLSDIAFALKYSSTPHLVNQFKKITGITPGNYKRLRQSRTQGLEKLVYD